MCTALNLYAKQGPELYGAQEGKREAGGNSGGRRRYRGVPVFLEVKNIARHGFRMLSYCGIGRDPPRGTARIG